MRVNTAAMLALLAPLSLSAIPASAGAEPALAHSAADPALKWGPCPAFLPKGCGIAVLHGDPSKPNADIFLKVPGKSELPMHTHTSAERMVLVGGEMHVTYEGQKKAVLKAGSYAYGPAGMPHKASCVSARPCILFIAFEGPVDAIAVEGAAK